MHDTAPPRNTPRTSPPTSPPPAPGNAPRTPLWNLPAAVAAWLLPGLGHLMTGEVKRGLILATTIGALWVGGLLIGGIGVIHAKQDTGQVRPWFLGQMLIAPSLIVEYTHDRYRAMYGGEEPEPDPNQPTLYEPSYGRAYEIGTLYTALAGLLNLLAVIDVMYRAPRPKNPASAAAAKGVNDG